MSHTPHPRRHRSSLEGIIVPSSQPLNPGERDLAIRLFNEIVGHFESSQGKDSGYKPVTLIRLMKNEVSEKDEFLNLFYSFLRQELLEQKEARLEQILSHLARFSHWPARDFDALRDSIGRFAKYLVDNFFLPRKVPGYIESKTLTTLSQSVSSEDTSIHTGYFTF